MRSKSSATSNGMNTTIQLRIDSKTKKQAQKKFRALGLDLSSAMKLFLRQAVKDEHLSFTPTIHKWTDLRHWRLYEKEIAWARKHGKRYATAEEMHADILKGVKQYIRFNRQKRIGSP